MSEKAKARIEAKLTKNSDPDGDDNETVRIRSDDLPVDEVEKVDYVVDVIDDGDEYEVIALVESGRYFTTT